MYVHQTYFHAHPHSLSSCTVNFCHKRTLAQICYLVLYSLHHKNNNTSQTFISPSKKRLTDIVSDMPLTIPKVRINPIN